MITRDDIKKLLIDCNVTAAELAKRLEMTPQALNSFLSKNFTQKDLLRIANALNVDYKSYFEAR